MSVGETVHATCVLLDRAGVLIRGASGSGKSTLALLLLDRAALSGVSTALIADDRVRLAREGDTLVARPHPALAGRIEVRGLGLCSAMMAGEMAHLRLVVDLVAERPRLPEAASGQIDLLGVGLPRLVLDAAVLRTGLAPRLVLDALAGMGGVAAGTHQTILDIPFGRRP
ncbi:hypothetical protein G3T14_09310 [Methylobacterium sp. BTF04]|uniref:HPr kinase/phosphorylase n=1 Tax=Methylobacterium sp. BTF04 TaxID=2708300 RepID=UPI0013D3D768|nr:hypothetical protein [Methylobacterium sp. BTF04]NEU12331.1 hypothetical protein [Methylobacterium sp. BTF04]